MTVSELIEHLKKWPADARVVVAGYEDGYDDAVEPASMKLAFDANASGPDYYGLHTADEAGVEAVVIGGLPR